MKRQTRMGEGCASARWWTVVLVGVGLTVACSGGGAGGDGIVSGPDGGSSLLSAAFTPEGSPTADSVALTEAAASADTVTLRVDVTDVAGVYGANFVLGFDDQRLQLVDWAPGNALGSPSEVVYLIDLGMPGQIELGASRTEPQGVDVTGSRPLVYLTFRAVGAGVSTLAFTSGSLLDDQPPPQTLPGISWIGGTIIAD